MVRKTKDFVGDDKPKTIVVLCCHRGGSSAVAGVLHYLGIDMGRGNFMGANAQNPYGYFEDARIVTLNDKILKACGTDWRATSIPDRLWDVWPRVSKEIKQLRNRQGTWGVKDPRMALTLPLYGRWLNNPYYVVVLREPEAVTQSLMRRDGWSHIQALDFVSKYYYLIRRTSTRLNAPKLEIRYEKLISSPETEIDRLARFVNLNGRVPEGFVDAELNHYAKSRPDALSGQSGDAEGAALGIEDAVSVREAEPALRVG